MKVSYLATLAALLLVSAAFPVYSHSPSRQVVASCAGVNPCAPKATNPCAGVNPCAPKATNPCAGVNPCAAKSASVGGPLAQELQGKPVLVDVYATWCPACKNVAPTLAQLKKQYEGKVNFVVLDVSNRTTTAEAEALAKKMGLEQFLAANKAQTGLLAVINPADGTILAQYRNNAKLEDYTKVLDTALAQ